MSSRQTNEQPESELESEPECDVDYAIAQYGNDKADNVLVSLLKLYQKNASCQKLWPTVNINIRYKQLTHIKTNTTMLYTQANQLK